MNSSPGQPTASSPGRWWHGAVLYQLYVRSWRDTSGDGYGDLGGVIDGLDYLTWLGVDGVWLSPTMPSPDADWGYDVSDYLGVHPELGTLADLDRLIAEAGQRGLRVLLDLVPNHTSSAHTWFVDAASGRDAGHRDFYVWAGPAMKGEGEARSVGGGPPNNWLDSTGASAWAWHEPTGQYYLHNFLPAQPDLNWWNPAVHEAFAETLRFWLDRGVAGFRIDVAHGLYKDAKLRDNPPAPADGPLTGRFGQLAVYNMNRPEVHGVYRDWRRIADSYPEQRLLLGETWVDLDRLGSFYGDDDELQLGFNFPFVFAGLTAPALSGVVAETLAKLPAGSCPVWTLSNHDVGRFPSRWCDGDPAKIRLALLVLTTMPGATVLYYGDEIGMTDVRVPLELQRDEMSRGGQEGETRDNRDRARTPMQWDATATAGFTADGVTPWLPVGDSAAVNVAAQRDDPGSVLALCRDLLRLRKAESAGQIAGYQALPAPPGVWSYRTGTLTVLGNFSGQPVRCDAPAGPVLLSTGGPASPAASTEPAWPAGTPAEPASGTITLAPWQGVVLRS